MISVSNRIVYVWIEALFNYKGEIDMNIAQVGNIIEFKQGLKGIVEKVNENSVIVDLTYMSNYRELDLEQRTVVNHKNYKIIAETL